MELSVLVRVAVFGICSGAVSQFAAGQCSQAVAGEVVPVPVLPHAFTYWDSDGEGALPAQLCVAASTSFVGDKAVFRWTGERWEPIGSNFNGNVLALTTINGALYAAGSFTKVGGQDILRIARWDGSNWVGVGAGFNGQTNALCEFQGELVAAGTFDKSASTVVKQVAAWNGSEWRSLAPNTTSASIYCLRRSGQQLIAGGRFSSINGVAARNVASFDGVSWKALGTGVLSDTLALGEYEGQLFAGGLSGVNSAVRKWDGISWTVVGSSGLGGQINAMYTLGDRLYAAGSSLMLANSTEAVDGVASWDGSKWSPVGKGETGLGDDTPSMIGGFCLSELNGQIVTGGFFFPSFAGSIARFTGTEWIPISDTLVDTVNAITVHNGRFVAVGNFIRIGEERTNHVMSWTGDGWEGFGAGLRSPGSAAADYNGQLIVSGGVPRELPADSGSVSAWNGNSWHSVGKFDAGTPQILTEYNGQLVAAGGVQPSALINAKGVAVWNGTSWSGCGSGIPINAFAPANQSIRAALAFSGRLIVGGFFSQAGETFVNNMAAWDGANWSHAGGGASGPVNTMVVWNGQLVIGGKFTFAGDTPVSNGAAWSGSGTNWTPLNSVAEIKQLLVYRGDLLARLDGQTLLKKWNGTGWEDFPFDPVGLVGVMGGEIATARLLGGQLIRPHSLPRFVSGTPMIPTQPNEPIAYCGAPATISVIVDNVGTNTPSYRWRRGEVELSDGPTGTGSVLFGTGTASIRIENVGPSDAGSYDVVVTNSCGTVTSTSAVVTPNCCPTDLDGNGIVDDSDFAMFTAAYDILACGAPEMSVDCPADFNRDGVVDDTDFQEFVVAYGQMLCE